MQLNSVFGSLFDVNGVESISVGNFFICLAVALGLGVVFAVCYAIKNRYTKSFLITLAILPAVVGMVIMLVNGNIGAGVAVAGAFSLIRFRSTPGTAKEICAIFVMMCTGLFIGMGFVMYASLFTVIMGVIFIGLNVLKLGSRKSLPKEKTLRITIPEDLNYTQAFDDIFKEYTERWETVSVKTTNMGSMFKLKYNVVLKDLLKEKEFIDALRCRNGNLEIAISNMEVEKNEF